MKMFDFSMFVTFFIAALFVALIYIKNKRYIDETSKIAMLIVFILFMCMGVLFYIQYLIY